MAQEMKTRIVVLLAILISLSACKELDELTQFTMDFNNKVTIPANTVINTPISISVPDISTNSASTFSGNNTNAGAIEEIKLQQMQLSIVSPAGSNFNFFKSVEVFMQAEGLPEVAVASETNVADGLTLLGLNTSDANLKEYITKDKFSIRFSTTTDEAITQDHEINVKTVFFIDAKILGQ